MEKCQDPLGPTYEWFKNTKGYSDERIIQSAMKPEGNDIWWIGLARKIGLFNDNSILQTSPGVCRI